MGLLRFLRVGLGSETKELPRPNLLAQADKVGGGITNSPIAVVVVVLVVIGDLDNGRGSAVAGLAMRVASAGASDVSVVDGLVARTASRAAHAQSLGRARLEFVVETLSFI